MTHGLNQEQLSHLKSLDSKKKQRKFLLDCMLENIDLEISNFFSKDYVKSENVENVGKSIVFINGMYETSNKKEIELLDSLHPMILREVDESNYIDNKNHLCWIFNRLIHHGENPNFDYMIKLKEIALNYSEPKQEVEEKVDLSKELYLTFDDGLDVFSIKVIDFEKKRGFGFDVDGCWNDSECTFWNWSSQPQYWRKSTPEEIKSMLIKKLEADGLKVGCKAIREWAKDEKIVPIKRIEYYYDSYHDTLECGGRTVYEKGKFATIIPWIEIQKEEEYLPYCVKVVDSNVEELTKLYNSIKMMEVKEIPTGMWLVCDTDNLEVINTPYKIVNTSDFMSYFQRYSSHAKLNKTENNELVNSSDEIKDIIVVDFENVSQKENPQ